MCTHSASNDHVRARASRVRRSMPRCTSTVCSVREGEQYRVSSMGCRFLNALSGLRPCMAFISAGDRGIPLRSFCAALVLLFDYVMVPIPPPHRRTNFSAWPDPMPGTSRATIARQASSNMWSGGKQQRQPFTWSDFVVCPPLPAPREAHTGRPAPGLSSPTLAAGLTSPLPSLATLRSACTPGEKLP